MATTPALELVVVEQGDPLAAPLLEELAREYSARYGRRTPAQIHRELRDHPAHEFSAPSGAFVVALQDGVPVAGGAVRRDDDETAELKRIWTSAAHRGRGLGRVVVAELERTAASLGYRRVRLTTGWNQPEAVALYLAAGYTPRYDTTLPPTEVGIHPFDKELHPG